MGGVYVRGYPLLALLFVSQFASHFAIQVRSAQYGDAHRSPTPARSPIVETQARDDRFPAGKQPQDAQTITLFLLLGGETARWRLR